MNTRIEEIYGYFNKLDTMKTKRHQPLTARVESVQPSVSMIKASKILHEGEDSNVTRGAVFDLGDSTVP